MILTKKNPKGQLRTMELPMHPDAFAAAHIAWRKGALIQDAFPTLTRDQREFIQTGYTPQDWADLFGSSERGD